MGRPLVWEFCAPTKQLLLLNLHHQVWKVTVTTSSFTIGRGRKPETMTSESFRGESEDFSSGLNQRTETCQ